MMGITVNQIANICGVSRTTVIRALNGHDRVGEETRQRILAVAQENGYRPNLLARSLNKGRTMSIGIITLDVENYIFAQSLGAVNQAAQKRGYFLNIALQGSDTQAELHIIRELTDRGVDGILLNPMNQGATFESFLLELGIPVVCIGNYVSDAISTVLIDEYRAARDAVSFLAARGYDHIVFVCPPLALQKEQNIYSHLQRLSGVEDEIAKHPGLRCEIIGNEQYLDAAVSCAKKRTSSTVLLCSGDIYALKILRALQAEGLCVPEDIGIMGFDNSSVLQYITPELTTVSTNAIEVASAAATELIARIEDPELSPKRIYLNHSIAVRQTV